MKETKQVAAHTPGTIRAANELVAVFSKFSRTYPPHVNTVADIIDKETGVDEMQAALELVAKTPHAINNWIDYVQTAIQKARGVK